jgi:hypothetical protein
MLKKILFLIIFYPKTFLLAQSVFVADTGEITFYSYAPVEDIQATSHKVNSMVNLLTGEIAFIIPIRSFVFEKSLMQEHFNEKYMESEKFPHATFNGKIEEKVDFAKYGAIPLTAKGKLNIHGVEKEIIQRGIIEIEKDKLMISTEMNVVLDDFNIKKPQLLFNNIADTINVKIKTGYVPYKKK